MKNTTSIRPVKNEGPLQVFQMENETGSASLTNWQVYPGIALGYIDAHMQGFTVPTPPIPNLFAINHCQEGRIECAFNSGEYLYMGKGDMSVGWRSSREYRHTAYFPTGHYHGLAILVDYQRAQRILDTFLDTDSFDLKMMCDRFCRHSQFGMILEENDSMKHLFYELYHVPEKIQHRYFRIKILEIFLFLNTLEVTEEANRSLLTRRQADLVKAVSRELEANLSSHQTIEEIAARYEIAPTSLKRCFKEVYGQTIQQYRRSLRMAKAKTYLDHSEESILAIANAVGYENSSKFAVAFKKETGMLPKDYRRQQSEQRL